MSCDVIEKSSTKTIKICYNYYDGSSKDDVIYDDLFAVAKFLEGIKPVFTAAGFYSINRGTIVKVFSALTTYMIIILQFNTTNFN